MELVADRRQATTRVDVHFPVPRILEQIVEVIEVILQVSVWCACQVPQERCMCWKDAPSNKYAACVELDVRPNSLRSLV